MEMLHLFTTFYCRQIPTRFLKVNFAQKIPTQQMILTTNARMRVTFSCLIGAVLMKIYINS